MKKTLLAIGVAAICSAGAFAADDNVRVKITGCVKDGEGDSFVLTNVQEMSGGKMSPSPNIYWLSTTKGLKEQIGHRVEVSGTFSPSRDEGKTGKIKIKDDPKTGEETIKVENGAIIANAAGQASHLFYDGSVGNHSFTNFDVRLDVLARYRSNGGVYVMTEFQPQGFPGKGFEIQVNNSHSDRIRTGSLYHIVDLSNIPGKDDEWIPMEIKAQGNTIVITVKGQEVVRWAQPADWQSNYDTASRKIAPGTIAFQSHDTYSVTAYSNIRIKLLK